MKLRDLERGNEFRGQTETKDHFLLSKPRDFSVHAAILGLLERDAPTMRSDFSLGVKSDNRF